MLSNKCFQLTGSPRAPIEPWYCSASEVMASVEAGGRCPGS
jgi:hypothetical protein